MVFDSITSASIPTAASNSKDFGKKKRVNRTAKLKQSKLDVRREQWLSQVKNKALGIKEEKSITGDVKMINVETPAVNEMVKLEINVAGEENHYSDSDSPSNSPTSHTSSVSGSNRSVTAFTGSSGRSSSGSSSSSASGGFCSGSMSDEDRHDDVDVDDDDDDCLDDWETMADALAAEDDLKNHNEQNVESHVHETVLEPETVLTMKPASNFRAWRPDDASRPQCLPNLLKQNSFPMKSGMCYNLHGGGFAPTACPICCEDLDMTDSSFLPCPCGYRLCLFCYKRILEDNGRCPGCRKQYSQPDHETAPLKLARCYSMNPNPKH